MPEQLNPETVAAESYDIQRIMYDYYTGYLFDGRSLDELRRLVQRCNDLIADRQSDEITFEALTILLQLAEDLPGLEALRVWSQTAERLIAGYRNDPKVSRVFEDYSILPPILRATADDLITRVIRDSDNGAVAGNVKYAQLSDFMVKEQYRGGLSPDERRTAIHRLQQLRELHGDAANANPRLHFGATLDEVARNDIFELENLHIGAKAPDIAGKDLEGLPMRLSDYKGKVVFLKFWGDW